MSKLGQPSLAGQACESRPQESPPQIFIDSASESGIPILSTVVDRLATMPAAIIRATAVIIGFIFMFVSLLVVCFSNPPSRSAKVESDSRHLITWRRRMSRAVRAAWVIGQIKEVSEEIEGDLRASFTHFAAFIYVSGEGRLNSSIKLITSRR